MTIAIFCSFPFLKKPKGLITIINEGKAKNMVSPYL